MGALAIRGRIPTTVLLLVCILCAAVLIAGTAVLTGCGSGSDTSALNGMTRNPPTDVGSVSLPDSNPASQHQGTSLKPDKEGLMLVYFGYTSCPDVCPTTLADLRLALAELSPDEREKVKIGMVTVDPDRDTGKLLNGYLEHFFPKESFSSFVAATPSQLASAEKAFGASHELGKPKSDGSYDVDHTAQIYAVDPNGVIRVEWPFGTDADDIADDLKSILKDPISQSGK